MKKVILLLLGVLLVINLFSQAKTYNQGFVCERTNNIWGAWEKAPSVRCKLAYNDEKFPIAVEINSEGERFYVKFKETYSEDSKGRYLVDIEKYEYTKGYDSVKYQWVELFKTRPIGAFVSKVKSKFYLYLVWDKDNGFGFALYNGRF